MKLFTPATDREGQLLVDEMLDYLGFLPAPAGAALSDKRP